jgi:tRNA dimethylallyltransferase
MQKAQEHGPEVLHDELRKLDPVTADRLHPRDLVRVIRALEVARVSGQPISSHQRQYPAPKPAVAHRMVALRRSEADLKERIRRRVARMFQAGLLGEVRAVLEGPGFSRSAEKAIGYREVIEHLQGARPLGETMELIERNTWRMARKQRAWLKSFPAVQWLDVAADEPAEATAEKVRQLLFESPN